MSYRPLRPLIIFCLVAPIACGRSQPHSYLPKLDSSAGDGTTIGPDTEAESSETGSEVSFAVPVDAVLAEIPDSPSGEPDGTVLDLGWAIDGYARPADGAAPQPDALPAKPDAPFLGLDAPAMDLGAGSEAGDITPPVVLRINDGTGADIDRQTSVNLLSANWAFENLDSGIARYEWAIGTSPGATDTMTWADVGTKVAASHVGLYLSGVTYYVSVRATNGAGLSTVGTSDGVTIDTTPFVVHYVNDGPGSDVDIQLSSSTISANWSIEDPAAGIVGYEWAIGTAAGAENLQPFTSVGSETYADAMGLSLPTDGSIIYVTVRATNGNGVTFTASSDGVQVGCAIAGGLVAGGAPDPTNPCMACLPGVRSDSLSPRLGGTVSCPAQGCGLMADGCGGLKACGDCKAPQTCGGGGVDNVCGCKPATCAGSPQKCGTLDDGCGGILNCATCAAPNHCGPLNLCGLADNLIIYSNYDGGTFTINVNEDLPNLAIGIVSYQPAVVTITGPYAGNVVAVAYAGRGSAPSTSVTGVAPSLVTIETLPPAPLLGFRRLFAGTAAQRAGPADATHENRSARSSPTNSQPNWHSTNASIVPTLEPSTSARVEPATVCPLPAPQLRSNAASFPTVAAEPWPAVTARSRKPVAARASPTSAAGVRPDRFCRQRTTRP